MKGVKGEGEVFEKYYAHQHDTYFFIAYKRRGLRAGRALLLQSSAE